MSQRNFAIIAKQAAKQIKRINYLEVDGAKIVGHVTSNSKISEWKFSLNFGSVDCLTGKYSKHSDNEDSDIPDVVGQSIKTAIRTYPDIVLDEASYYAFCPYCGKRLSGKPGNYCSICGTKFDVST